MTESRAEPLVVLDNADEWRAYAGRTDVLVVVLSDKRVQLPQFDIEVGVEGLGGAAKEAAIERALREMLALYRALDELPDHYINEIEQAQIEVIDEVFAPWVMRHIAKEPESFALPPLDAERVGA